MEGIAGMVNWIGVGPHKKYADGKRGPEVTFDRFVFFVGDGPDYRNVAPVLAKRFYGRNVRSVLQGLTDEAMAEALGIVAMADDAPPSPTLLETGEAEAFDRCKRTARCSKGPPEP